jgi:hypothetical protein
MASILETSFNIFKQIFGCKKIFLDDSDEEEERNSDPVQFIRNMNEKSADFTPDEKDANFNR